MVKDAGASPSASVRGRPSKRDARLLRERIQQAALDEFRQHGYAGTSIDGIARAASASRTTIYALYSDKQTLFTEMVRAYVATANLVGRVRFDDRPPEQVLREALIAINRAYYAEPTMEILRMCIGETERFPTFIESILESLSGTLTGLTEYLERLHRSGRMFAPDPKRMASTLNLLALGSLTPLFVRRDRLPPDAVDGHLDAALTFFIRGCRCDPPPL